MKRGLSLPRHICVSQACQGCYPGMIDLMRRVCQLVAGPGTWRPTGHSGSRSSLAGHESGAATTARKWSPCLRPAKFAMLLSRHSLIALQSPPFLWPSTGWMPVSHSWGVASVRLASGVGCNWGTRHRDCQERPSKMKGLELQNKHLRLSWGNGWQSFQLRPRGSKQQRKLPAWTLRVGKQRTSVALAIDFGGQSPAHPILTFSLLLSLGVGVV